MNETRRLLPLAALAAGAAALAPRPAAACDPELMDAHLTAVCEGALEPAKQALEAAMPHATPAERMAMRVRRLAEAEATATRLRWMLILVTLLAGGFGSAMMLAVIRHAGRGAPEVAAGRELR